MAELVENPLAEQLGVEAPAAAPETTPDADLDTAEDELLARIDAAEDEIGVLVDEPEEPTGANQEQEDEDTSSDQEEAREQPAPIDSEEMDNALSALRRDGLPTEVIERMTNQEVLELGQKRLKVQADTDNAYRELRELQDPGKAADKPVESEDAPEPTEPPGTHVVANLDEAVKPFAALFGDDGAEALVGIQEAALAPVLARMEQMVNTIGNFAAKDARRELRDQYPQLSDDKAYSQVEERMGKLIKSGSYTSPHELMADAARLTFADDQRDAARAYRDKIGQMRTNGQMSSSSKQSAPASLSQEDREDMVLELLEDGGSTDDARRAYDGSNQ